MEETKEILKDDELLYGINDKPNIMTQILLGFQNIFAAFGGIIAVPLVISNALGFNTAMSTAVMFGFFLCCCLDSVLV